MVRELLALGSLALPAVGCEGTDCGASCPDTGIIRAYTANGEPLDVDEVLVELHGDDIVCSVAVGETETLEPCETTIRVRRGTPGSCTSTEDCIRDEASTIRIIFGQPDGPVSITLIRDGEAIAKRKFGLQPALGSPDCGTCDQFQHHWRLDS